LINLTGSNRLLNFKPSKSSAVTILAPTSAEVTQALDSKAEFEFKALPGDAASEDPEQADVRGRRRSTARPLHAALPKAELTNALRNLQRRSDQDYLDRGLWVLYLAVGTLNWDDEAGGKFSSPLLLLPVQLIRQGPKQLPHLGPAEEEPVINPALALKLSQSEIELPTIDALEAIEPGGYLELFRSAVSHKPRWKVEDSLTLSYFTFAKEAMYRDLLDNEDVISAHPAIVALAAGGRGHDINDFGFDPIPDSEIDARAAADRTPLVLDADSSQRACIAAALDGRSFVMDGPPGTGKSQTIANMIGTLLHAGKSVLFVSEKAAALDVVRNRLTHVGLGSYLLELHSHKATRKQVAATLGEALDQKPVPPPGMEPGDLEQLRRRQRELNEYAEAMNVRRKPLDYSLHTVLGWISELHDVAEAPRTGQGAAELTVNELAEVRRDAGALARAWRPALGGHSFVWRGVIEQRTMDATLYSAATALRNLRSESEANWDLVDAFAIKSPDDVSIIDALLTHRDRRPADVPDEWLTTPDLSAQASTVQELSDLLNTLTERRLTLQQYAGTAWSRVPQLVPDPLPTIDDHGVPELVRIEADNLNAADARTIADRLSTQAIMIESRVGSLAGIAESLGVSAPATFQQTHELLRLAAITAYPNRPEAHWITGGTQEPWSRRAVLANAEASLVEAETLGSVRFTPAALDHDVAGIKKRFEEEHRGLRKLGSACRKDKRVVLSFTQEGTRPQEALTQLGTALAWKEAAQSYTDLVEAHAPLLGSYYTGRGTDYLRIDEALGCADEIIRLVRPDELASVAARIACNVHVDAALAVSAHNTKVELQAWGSQLAPAPASNGRPQLLGLMINKAATWLLEQAASLREAARVAETVSTAIDRNVTFGEALHLLDLRVRTDAATSQLERAEPKARAVCGGLYIGDQTQPADLDSALAWARAARSIRSGSDCAFTSNQVAELADAVPVEALRPAIEAWDNARASILGAFSAERHRQMSEDLSDWEDAAELLESLRSDSSGQDDWLAYVDHKTKLTNRGLGTAVAFCISERLPAESVPKVIEKALLREWADHQIAHDKSFALTRASDRDNLVEEYRALDKQMIASAISQILTACNDRRPRVTMGQSQVIRREAEKKRKHMPVRDLLARSSAVTQIIKPCFMMSPLAVSQYLPGTLKFDVVIFDEASQVAPQDSINCIYRGEALILAGDQKQLPPTNFFTSGEDESDEWDEGADDATDFESILDLAKSSGTYRDLTLSWHYRSRHEHLIAFSNSSFYRGKLITFPGAEHEGPDVGVEFIPVEGVYRRGTSRDNPIEAQKVVERILHHFDTRPDRSLGVVTFSESQAAMIESVLEDARRDRPDLERFFTSDRLDGFFVKNLESVQGDERDVMIFSLGYGPDENGKFTLSFGPVTRSGGWRRLNVAVTRARFRNEIVASFRSSDIGATGKSEGIRHLRRYLDFAERGIGALALDVSEGGDAESPFEESVISAVRSWGYDVVPQVGTAGYRIDLGVRHPERPGVFMLGIECDGFRYHSSKTARDRDRLREEVLSGLGWRLHRIWGTAWYRNRSDEEQRLKLALETAMHAPIQGLLVGGDSSSAETKPKPVVTVEPVLISEVPSWVVPYHRVVSLNIPSWIDLSEPSSRYRLTDPIKAIVSAEGPIHIELIHQRIRENTNTNRIGSKIKSNIGAAIRRAELIREGEFVRTLDQGATVRSPSDECSRPIDHVHDAELCSAIYNLARDAGGITEKDLATATARIFGWSRTGSDITSRLTRLISLLKHKGSLVETECELSAGPVEPML